MLRRWIEEGEAGLEDKPRGPKGVCKVDLRAMNEVRKLQENPELGAFRVSAALAQIGIYLSARTCGRILATNRKLYGLKKPKRGSKEKKEMPFKSDRRHEYWTVDIRYINEHRIPEEGTLYVISVLENHSRAILASSISRSQDTTAYLSVLYSAVTHYGAPEAIVTDRGGVFKATQSKAVYRSLGITKKEIERGQTWQSYIETHFNTQRRMAGYYFAQAESFEELVAAHDRFVENHNTQKHFAHEDRKDGRRSPSEVLGWLTTVRHLPEALERAFFSVRFTRILDASGYARIRHWRVYAEEGLAKCEVALWLGMESLTVEYAGETLSRYEVEYSANTAGGLRGVQKPMLFETSYGLLQLGLFKLDDKQWLKALKLRGYAPRRLRRPRDLQRQLFSDVETL